LYYIKIQNYLAPKTFAIKAVKLCFKHLLKYVTVHVKFSQNLCVASY